MKNNFTRDGFLHVKLIQPAAERVASCDVSLFSSWGLDGQLSWLNTLWLPRETMLLPLGRTFPVPRSNPTYLALHLLGNLIQTAELAGLVCLFIFLADKIPGVVR